MRNIINVCRDPELLRAHALVLESSGHHVLGVLNFAQLQDALHQDTCDLVLVGSSIPPNEKRRILSAVKLLSQQCRLLEMYDVLPELPEANAWVRDDDGPDALLRSVNDQFAANSEQAANR